MNNTLQDISISEAETPDVIQHTDGTGIPVCPVSMPARQHKHITHTVPEHTLNGSVMEKPGPNISNPQKSTVLTQEPSTGELGTGSPKLNAGAVLEQCVIETPQEKKDRERREIIEGCGLASSDEDEANETVRPQTSALDIADT